jgi:hypothetical protein
LRGGESAEVVHREGRRVGVGARAGREE